MPLMGGLGKAQRSAALLVVVAGISVAAGCASGTAGTSPGSAAASPSPSPTPDVGKLYLAAADKSNAVVDATLSDINKAIQDHDKRRLTDAAYLARLNADAQKIADSDDAFVADILKIPFPDKMHSDIKELVAAVSKHRDAWQALSTASTVAQINSAVDRRNAADSEVSAAVDIIRSDLGLPRAPNIGGSPSPTSA